MKKTQKNHSVPKKSVDMLNVQIDGEWRQFPKGTRMIEACRQVQKEIPHYCYHHKLSSPGNCRMCLVEMGMPPRLAPGEEPERDEQGFAKIQWSPRPVIACANIITEGMGIRTNSTLAKECRHGVMEFLLINHPLDCPICDQAGECRLQEFSVEHGKGGSRFLEQKVKKPKNVDIGPRIRLDDERCILCSRCIRFCDEVVDDAVLGFTDRGSHTTLTVHPGKKLANNYSLNTADICPVGALTSTDFRFQMRVWFLKETKSIDVHCGTGCNILIGSRENKVYRITPRENNAVNSCWIPDSHRLDFHFIDSDKRLTDPLIKKEGVHALVTWKEALTTTAQALKTYAPHEIAIIASGHMTNEELYLMRKLCTQLKVETVDNIPRMEKSDGYLISADRNPNTEGVKRILIDHPGSSLEQIKEGIDKGSIKALLVFYEDLIREGFEKKTLAKLSFLASNHILANATAELSHVVLPGYCFAEKRGSMINVTGRLQRLNKAIEGPGHALDDWEILHHLTRTLSPQNEEPIYHIEDVFKEIASILPEFSGLSLSKIGDLGVQIVETGTTIPLIERERERIAQGEIVGYKG